MADLKLKLLKETPNAFLFDNEGQQAWVPRSLVSYIKKGLTAPDGSRDAEVVMEGWKAKQLKWH